MKKGLTEIVFILDNSGSMEGLEKDTIGGYNSFLEKQKKLDGEAYVSTVLFNTKNQIIHDRVPIRKIEPMNEKQYCVGGGTALLDAIGGAINHIGNIHKYARKEDVPEKTIFVITTDGEENSSVDYNYAKVKKMIERQQKRYHWEFLFLGANMDAVGEAAKIGIRKDRAVNYECDEQGTSLNFISLSSAVGCVREGGELRQDWCEEICAYQESKMKELIGE